MEKKETLFQAGMKFNFELRYSIDILFDYYIIVYKSKQLWSYQMILILLQMDVAEKTAF